MFSALFEIPIFNYFFAVLFPHDGNAFKAQTNQNLSHLIGWDCSGNSAGVGGGVIFEILWDISRT